LSRSSGERDPRGLPRECVGVKDVVWGGDELDWVAPAGGVRAYLRGVGLKFLLNEFFEKGFRKLLEAYSPGRRYELCLIIPCAYGKPYSQSYIHYAIRSAIKDYLLSRRVHEVIVTNAGVVPRELDEFWPYCAYDWNPAHETPEVKACYTAVLAGRLEAYLRRHGRWYGAFAAYLRWGSDSWRAVEEVSRRLGVPIPNLAPRESEVPEREVREAGLGGLYEDEDLVLITPTALNALREGLARLLRG